MQIVLRRQSKLRSRKRCFHDRQLSCRESVVTANAQVVDERAARELYYKPFEASFAAGVGGREARYE